MEQNKINRKISGCIYSIIVSALAIIISIFLFVSQIGTVPRSRDDAICVEGTLEVIVCHDDDVSILLQEGSRYFVYYLSVDEELKTAVESIESGDKLYLIIDPTWEYVLEIRTDMQTILNFDDARARMLEQHNHDISMTGIVFTIAVVDMIVCTIKIISLKKKTSEENTPEEKIYDPSEYTQPLRYAEEVKCKILLEQEIGRYRICYRRVKSVNELVINDRVYAEKKGIIEFKHALVAVVDGHRIEAGLDAESYSYIEFNGKRVAQKLRLI